MYALMGHALNCPVSACRCTRLLGTAAQLKYTCMPLTSRNWAQQLNMDTDLALPLSGTLEEAAEAFRKAYPLDPLCYYRSHSDEHHNPSIVTQHSVLRCRRTCPLLCLSHPWQRASEAGGDSGPRPQRRRRAMVGTASRIMTRYAQLHPSEVLCVSV